MMAQPIECTAVDMESSAIQQFVSTEGNYVSTMQIFREFLHPRYWLTWFGLGVLWLWVQLPYPVLCFLGTRIGAMARPFLKRRESIARKTRNFVSRSILRKNARR